MTTNIDENIKSFRQIYSDCSDIKMQEMYLGRDASIKCFVAYIEVTCAGSGINNSAFGRFTSYLEGIDRDQVYMTIHAMDQGCKPSYILIGIIDTTD